MTVTLAELTTGARQRADQLRSKFVSDSEATKYINDGYGELYDMLVLAYQDYFLADPYEFTVASGDSEPLPSDFYKVTGVDISLNGDWRLIFPFNFINRNAKGSSQRLLYSGLESKIRYRILGSNIKFIPGDVIANQTFRLWFVPRRTKLVLSTDAIDAQSELWSEFIEVTAAIDMVGKEESSTSELRAKKQELTLRIKTLAVNRDAGHADQITDVRGGGLGMYGYGSGSGYGGEF